MSNDPMIPETGFEPGTLLAKTAKWSRIVGFVLVLIGIASLMLPAVTAMAVDVWIGVLFLLVGGSCYFQAFQTRPEEGFAYDLIWGTLYLITGLMLVVYPKDGIVTIALILGLAFVIAGLARIPFARRLPAGRSRLLWYVDGAIGVLLGGIILANWPGDSAWIIGVLVGMRFLFSGIAAITFSGMIQPRK